MIKIIKRWGFSWEIREETLLGNSCQIIYCKLLGTLLFLERYNTLESAQERLKELRRGMIV